MSRVSVGRFSTPPHGAGLDVATAGLRHLDPTLGSLVDALQQVSEEFRGIWARQEVAVHPEVGRLELQCDTVLSPPSGQRLVLFRPDHGTGTGERLAMLGVSGTQSSAGPDVTEYADAADSTSPSDRSSM